MTFVRPFLLVLWCCTFLSRSQVCPAEEMPREEESAEETGWKARQEHGEEHHVEHGRRLTTTRHDNAAGTYQQRQAPTEPPGVDCWDMNVLEKDCGPAHDWRQAFAPYENGGVCRCYQPPAPLTGPQARIAYLIIVHNARTMDDAAYLFRAIRFPSSIILIHVDTKCPMSVYEESQLRKEVDHCSCGATVFVDSVHSSIWSEWTMNEPTLWSMDILVHDERFRNKWDVYMNLSGDTMPVLTPDRMAKLFAGPLKDTNFVTSASCETGLLPSNVYIFPKGWHKRKVYTHFGDKEFHHYETESSAKKTATAMIGYFGSQWMVLTSDFVTHVATEMKRKGSLTRQWRDFLVETKLPMTDETFFPTILMHTSPFNETLPKVNGEEGNLIQLPSMYAIRYERMDEHMPSAFGYVTTQQRYTVPMSSLADTPKVWGPYFLGAYDLYNIKMSGALFARKVSVHVDPNVVHLLPVRHFAELPHVQWPSEVHVEPMVPWVRAAKFGQEAARKQMEKHDKKKKKQEEDEDEDKKKKQKKKDNKPEKEHDENHQVAVEEENLQRKRKQQARRLQEEGEDEGEGEDADEGEDEGDGEDADEGDDANEDDDSDEGDFSDEGKHEGDGEHDRDGDGDGEVSSSNAEEKKGEETEGQGGGGSDKTDSAPTPQGEYTWIRQERVSPPPVKARRDGAVHMGMVALHSEDVVKEAQQ